MQTQLVSILRMSKTEGKDPGLYIFVNQSFAEAFELTDTIVGGIASFSIEGCVYRVRVGLMTDDSAETRLYLTEPAIQLTGLKPGSIYLISYHHLRRRFTIGYRKKAQQASYHSRVEKPIISVLNWNPTENVDCWVLFLLRGAAFLFDAVFLIVCCSVIFAVFDSFTSFSLSLAACWFYHAICESSSTQATLGKLLCGLRVTDLNGNRISFGKASVRFVGKVLSVAIFFIGYLMVGWTTQKQTLHDILAGCFVIKPHP